MREKSSKTKDAEQRWPGGRKKIQASYPRKNGKCRRDPKLRKGR